MHLNEPAQSLKRTARRALSVPADPFPEEAWDEVQADPKKASDKHKDAVTGTIVVEMFGSVMKKMPKNCSIF